MADSEHQPSAGLPAANALPGVRSIVAVGAGKGGVGKSTASVLLAIGLQREGARVGLLDADIYGPSIPTLMGIAGSRPEMNAETSRIHPVAAKGVKTISVGLLIDPSEAVVWRGPMVHNVISQTFLRQVEWGELDYMIVDLPPGTGDAPLTLAQSLPMTGSVVVCTPQDIALQDARRALKMYEMLNVPSLGIIENMSYYLCPKCGNRDEIFDSGGAEQAAAALNVPFLGAVPLNGAIRRFCDDGMPEMCFTDCGEHVTAALQAIITSVKQQIDKRSRTATTPKLSIE